MQKTNSIFLKNQLTKFVLDKFSINEMDNIKFVIEYDLEEKQEPKTNSDDIMRLWSLPSVLGKKLDLSEVCERLVTHKNEIPLWIKIKSTSENNILKLQISKRFRKMKIIEEWHKLNEYKPIIKINATQQSV